MSIKLSKEDIKGPDQFIKTSSHLVHFVTEHKKLIIQFTVLLAIGLLGFGGYIKYSSMIEEDSRSLYFDAKKLRSDFDKVQDEKQKIAKDDFDKKHPPQKDKNKKEIPSKVEFVFTKEPIPETVTNKYSEVVQKYKKTDSAKLAALEASDIFLDKKEYDKSLEILTQVPAPKVAKNLIDGAFLFQLGRGLISKNNLEDAIKYFDTILKSEKVDFWHGQANLNKAICLEKLGKIDEAKKIFDSLTNEFQGKDIGNSARTYKILLENKVQN